MKTTTYFKLRKPEGTDPVNIDDFNENFDTIDTQLKAASDASGDLSRGTIYASTATARDNLASGETMATMVGKIMKWFSDMKAAAFCAVANNDTVSAEGYVADARIVKEHGDEIDKHTAQLGGLYLGQSSSGKYGYKTTPNGTVIPFRNPTGTATAGDVLVGKTFANASSDNLTGTMPNNGDLSKTVTPTGNNSATYVIPAGYTSGGTVTADGTAAYGVGYTEGESAGYTDGYNDKAVAVMLGWSSSSDVSATITAGTYRYYYFYKSMSEAYNGTDSITIKVGNATYFTKGFTDSNVYSASGTLSLPAGTLTLHVKNGANNQMFSGMLAVYKV